MRIPPLVLSYSKALQLNIPHVNGKKKIKNVNRYSTVRNVLSGDFNGRVSNKNDFIFSSIYLYVLW